MPITVNTTLPEIERTRTGLYSFDRALAWENKLGLPTRAIVELYGQEHIGKSTMAYYLAGTVNPTGKVLLCDFEGMDIEHLPRAMIPANFDGSVDIITAQDSKGKMRDHEDMLEELTQRMLEEADVSAGIVDSIGAITPIFERESDIGEGFGAKRATIVAKFSRKANYAIINRETPANLFVTNHSHQIVSGMGHSSAGGVTLKYLEAVRLFMRFSVGDFIKSGDEVLSYVIKGKVEKLRYGGKGREFKFVITPGYGVRPNLTAIIDCVDLKLADRGAVVKIEDKSLGRIGQLYEADLAEDKEQFLPFYEALKKHEEGKV